jgi:carbamoyltransferase
MSYILGISCGYHDSAASLIKDGRVLGACEEERFTGIKHDNTFPIKSIAHLYAKNGIQKDDVEAICFYENPKLKLDRIEESTKRGHWLWNYFTRKRIIKRNKKEYDKLQITLNSIIGKDTKIVFSDHHSSHINYSYLTSPFEEANILSIDGVGEWETTVLAKGNKNKIEKIQSIDFPHSLGMLYSSMTAFLGFKPNEGEYKVMGLAPYGDPSIFLKRFKNLYNVNKDNSFEINMKYFTYDYSDKIMFNEKLGELFGITNRLPEEPLEQHHKDLAATLQTIYEFLFFKLLNKLHQENPTENICLSGGCAYNGTANGKILKRTPYKNLWIPPAPSDAGSAIGCALEYYHSKNDNPRVVNTTPYLGPSYTKDEILTSLEKYENDVFYETKLFEQITDVVAKEISEGNIIGWFQGRSEFGARALGNRSIFANPRDPQMKRRLNRVIKKREGFRPFAPIVKEELATKFFDYEQTVPYMNQVVKVKKEHRKELPSITHIDGSARIQTLTKNNHRVVYDLLTKLNDINGYPIVINTSFNLKDQTMVLTPEDAIKTFLNCEMDTLILGHYIVRKKIL